MNVLSLFDGISCAYNALIKAKIDIKTYYASEIDTNAIKVSKANNPTIIHLGNVKEINGTALPKIDLLIGGSPCTDLSISKQNREGLKGQHSSLFWEYVRLKKEVNPTYFILENVASMPIEDKKTITETLGVEPILFNASLVSAQNRKRLFWTNIKFELPTDKGILLKDILQSNIDEKMFVNKELITKEGQKKNASSMRLGNTTTKDNQANRVYDINGKSVSLKANGGGLGAKTGLYMVNNRIRRLTTIECERLTGLPDNYTNHIAITNRYKCLGNAFHVDVVAHILSSIK
jgi:DNA-cytosine methyltransferase